MTLIPHLCDRIVAKLSALGSPIANLLLPGLSDEELQQIQSSLPLKLPEAATDMYKWRNGTRLSAGATFFPWWTFDTITESAERYRVLSAPNDELWNDRLFPIFSASDVSSIGITCGDTPTKDGTVYCFEYMLGTEPDFDSLEAMLRTILEAYEAGVIFVKDASLDYDESAFATIAQRINPGIPRRNN